MEESYCQRMKYFVLKDHICSHLLLGKSRSSVLLCSGACRAVMHQPESGSLELLGGSTAQQKAEGDQGPEQASCNPRIRQSQAKPHLTPKAAAASGAEQRQPETPWVCHSCRGLSHILQKHTRGCCSVSALCGRPCWEHTLKGTALKAGHCTTAFLCCATDWVPVLYH